MSARAINMTGERVGRWTVLERAGRREDNGQALWLCQCDCGAETVHSGSNLRRRRTLSCGCRREPVDLTAPVTYAAAHKRVRAKRGPATAYRCVDCGEPANEWSYNHCEAMYELEQAVRGERGHVSMLRFHPNPIYYSPRCRTCHALQRQTVAHWDLESDPALGRAVHRARRAPDAA